MTATATDGGRAVPDATALPPLRPLTAREPQECAHPVLAAVLAELRERVEGRGAYFSDAPAVGAYFADAPAPRRAGAPSPSPGGDLP
ncbi:hypothetical protein [Streptomyces sp. CBMA152]|uniref:hypothetical protein n=1 Tax=Streptomyces sp. CBMA152 TaxID=1896312 RepID=UPI0016604E71|nr:hypothetical protein [Streptomyces sp. CBMA152]MBD0747601.1 hypothetical protein [Streptomyces sp. CBMA152]